MLKQLKRGEKLPYGTVVKHTGLHNRDFKFVTAVDDPFNNEDIVVMWPAGSPMTLANSADFVYEAHGPSVGKRYSRREASVDVEVVAADEDFIFGYRLNAGTGKRMNGWAWAAAEFDSDGWTEVAK